MDQMADAIAGYLAKVGIKAKRRHIEDVGLWTKLGQGGEAGGHPVLQLGLQLHLRRRRHPLRPDLLQGAALLHQGHRPWTSSWTRGGPQIDPKKRQEAYAKAQKLLHEKYLLDPHQRPVHHRRGEQEAELRGGQRRDDAGLRRLLEGVAEAVASAATVRSGSAALGSVPGAAVSCGFFRSRYEITYPSLSISLRLLMPFRNVSAQLIL